MAYRMKYDNYVWVALTALAFLGTTSEARVRRKAKAKIQSDEPHNVQNQAPSDYDDYGTEYEYYDELSGKCKYLSSCLN